MDETTVLIDLSDFVINVTRSTAKKIMKFIQDCFKHTESIILLTASSVGITSMLVKFTMPFAIPAFIARAMVLPVIAVAITLALTDIASYRARRRLA